MKIEKIAVSAIIPNKLVGDTFLSWTVVSDDGEPMVIEDGIKETRKAAFEVYKEAVLLAISRRAIDAEEAKMRIAIMKSNLEKLNSVGKDVAK